MNDQSYALPDSVNRFINERRQVGGVAAVLIYGSYARGTQHEKSDVDIIFVVDDGFKSEFVVYEGLDFEILEATKSDIFAYWQKNWDEDRHWYLWKDAKLIYDRDGTGANVIKRALSLVNERSPWSRERIQSRKPVENSKLAKINYIAKTDPATAALLLVEFVRDLTQNWFRIHGQYIPSTKEFLALFAQESPELEALTRDFYLNATDLDAKLTLASRMLNLVYR